MLVDAVLERADADLSNAVPSIPWEAEQWRVVGVQELELSCRDCYAVAM